MAHPITRTRKFDEMILPHLNAAYNLARWLTRNERDAKDVAQEAYLHAFRFFNSYHDGDPRAGLLSIVRNTYRSWLRAGAAARVSLRKPENAQSPALGRSR
jgi:RNA polymerase sigma-70 factor (ECF subfamily)